MIRKLFLLSVIFWEGSVQPLNAGSMPKKDSSKKQMIFEKKLLLKLSNGYNSMINLNNDFIMSSNIVNTKLPKGFFDGYEIVGSVKIYYVAGGNKEKPVVLLIPGWPQTWYIWRHIMETLIKDYYVIAVDPRGIGNSSRPDSGYDTGTAGADLNSLVNKLGFKKYNIVGHDTGMWIAYAMASDFPNSVQKLAVTEASIPGVTEFPNLMMPKELVPFRAQFLFNQLPDLPEMLTEGREEIYLKYIFQKMAFKLDRVAVTEYIKAYKKKGAMKAGFEYYRAIPETKAQNEKRMQNKLKMPVLALGGDHSGRLNNLKTMQSVAINVKGGELKDCGHYTPEECPDEFLEQLIQFLKE